MLGAAGFFSVQGLWDREATDFKALREISYEVKSQNYPPGVSNSLSLAHSFFVVVVRVCLNTFMFITFILFVQKCLHVTVISFQRKKLRVLVIKSVVQGH